MGCVVGTERGGPVLEKGAEMMRALLFESLCLLAITAGCTAAEPQAVDGTSNGTLLAIAPAGAPATPLSCTAIPGIVGCWTFDGDVLDHSGNGHNGVLHGGAAFTAGAGGRSNTALALDGVDDYPLSTHCHRAPTCRASAAPQHWHCRSDSRPSVSVFNVYAGPQRAGEGVSVDNEANICNASII